jgi:hypothetical protein
MKKTLKTISTLYLAFLFIAGWIISSPKQNIILQLTPIPPLLIFIYRMYKKWQQNKVIEEPKNEDSICSYVIGFILKVINIICIGCMVAIGYKWTLGVSEPLAYFMPAFPITFFILKDLEGKSEKYKSAIALIFMFWGIIFGIFVIGSGDGSSSQDSSLWHFEHMSCEGNDYNSRDQWLNCYPLCMLGNFVFLTSVLSGLFSTIFILMVKFVNFIKKFIQIIQK